MVNINFLNLTFRSILTPALLELLCKWAKKFPANRDNIPFYLEIIEATTACYKSTISLAKSTTKDQSKRMHAFCGQINGKLDTLGDIIERNMFHYSDWSQSSVTNINAELKVRFLFSVYQGFKIYDKNIQ